MTETAAHEAKAAIARMPMTPEGESVIFGFRLQVNRPPWPMEIADITVSEDALTALCQKWKIRRLELFGSAESPEFTPESDIDLLVDFEDDENWSLMDLVRAQEDFGRVFGRAVDLVDRVNLERSENWIRRNSILKSTRLLYAS